MTLKFDLFCKLFKISFIIIWLVNLATTDAYISIYSIVAFVAFFSVIQCGDVTENKKNHILFLFIAILFSILTLLANYPIFTQIRDLERIQASTNMMVNAINTCFSFLGGIIVGYSVITFLWMKLQSFSKSVQRSSFDKRYLLFVAFSFVTILSINLIHLFFVEFPGNVTEDPFSQISEMVSGHYSNFNTFWHTMFMQGILSIGYSIFGNVNAAVAVYCVVQSLIVTASFVFCLSTLYLAGVPAIYLICAFLIYGILPYNIALSITIWKDVLFAAGCLFMICAIFRMFYGFGRYKWINYIGLIVGSIFFALSRNNGWYVYFVTLLISLWPLRKDKKILAVLVPVFTVCWFMTNPLLSLLHVSGNDYTEALSVPLQQVSRVIVDGCELTEEETTLISQVLDIDEVPELYTNWLSDPIKVEFRSNNTTYFEAHIGDYVKLWVKLGLRYPGEYVKAWVDQTKGYWNGGYGYGMYSETVTDNPYGVQKASNGNIIATLFRLYFGLSRHIVFFEPLHSIGLHVWITALCCLFNAMLRRKEWVLSVPLLVIVLGLCLGTPVYASFRYAYPVFVCVPFILGITMYRYTSKK